jgi:hypothetical protein
LNDIDGQQWIARLKPPAIDEELAMSDTSERYLNRAHELEMKARVTSNAEARNAYLRMASNFRRLASRDELCPTASPSRKEMP